MVSTAGASGDMLVRLLSSKCTHNAVFERGGEGDAGTGLTAVLRESSTIFEQQSVRQTPGEGCAAGESTQTPSLLDFTVCPRGRCKGGFNHSKPFAKPCRVEPCGLFKPFLRRKPAD